MTVNVRYRKDSEAALASYDFVDLATGTAYSTFYAGTVSGSNLISSNEFYSNTLLTDAGLINSTSYTKKIDIDFDADIQETTWLRGEAIIDIPIIFYHTGGSATPTVDAYAVVKIRRWDGTTETEIAEGSSPTFSITDQALNTWNYKIRTARVEVPRSKFKAGETLRMTVEVYAREGEVNNTRVLIAHDPQDRRVIDGETYVDSLVSGASILQAAMPFEVDR